VHELHREGGPPSRRRSKRDLQFRTEEKRSGEEKGGSRVGRECITSRKRTFCRGVSHDLVGRKRIRVEGKKILSRRKALKKVQRLREWRERLIMRSNVPGSTTVLKKNDCKGGITFRKSPIASREGSQSRSRRKTVIFPCGGDECAMRNHAVHKASIPY